MVAREIVLLPLVLCGALVVSGIASLENGTYLALGMAILLFFSAVLGLHVGLSYPASRRAIAVALGTVAGIAAAVALGDDTDTIAAITGSLLGTWTGAEEIPQEWADVVHGWPGYDGPGLVALAREIAP